MFELTDLEKIPQRFYGRVYYRGNKTTYWQGYPIPPNSLISLHEEESVIWDIIQNPDKELLIKLQNLEQYYFNEVMKIDTVERCILTQNQSERHPNLLDWAIDSYNLLSMGTALSGYQRPEIIRLKKNAKL